MKTPSTYPCELATSKPNRVDMLVVRTGWKCNYSCSHCAAWTLEDLGSNIQLDINRLNKALLLIENLLPAKKVNLYGGEPFIHKELKNIVCRSSSISKNVEILTNGSILKSDLIWLSELIETVSIVLSLEGPLEINDKIRGVGAFNNAIDSSKLLKEHNINFSYRITYHKFNVEYLSKDFFEFLLETGAESIFIHPHYYNSNWSKAAKTSKQKHLISWAKLYDQFGYINQVELNKLEKFEMNILKYSNLISLVSNQTPSLNDEKCSFSGRCPNNNEIVIQPDGSVARCRYLPVNVKLEA